MYIINVDTNEDLVNRIELNLFFKFKLDILTDG